jgi:Uma2 family endonuclease
VGDNATVHLGPDTEVQPDLLLRILPECGGQTTTNQQGYIEGAPEFVAEIAVSSQGVDLNAKRRQYARYGVREYVVACVKEQQLRWFDLAAGQELQPDANSVCRVHTFPGLWIDGKALFAHDYTGLMRTLNEGLATPEHAAFARELESRRGR